MHERLPSYDVVAHAPEEPVRLYGPPTQVAGSVALRNPGEERAVLRRASLVGDFLAGGRHTERMSTVKLEPASEGRFDLAFNLDPHTPPGRYECEMEVAGVRRRVEVHVTEVANVRFEPRTLVVQAPPGSTVSKQLVVHNLGNVPLVVEPHLALALDDDLIDCRVLREGLTRFAERDEGGLDQLLRDLAVAGRRVLDDAGVARVKVISGSGEVAPGEVRALDLEVAVPSTLRNGSRYGGRITIGHRVAGVLIVPQRGDRPAPEVPEGPPAPAPATRPATPRKAPSRAKAAPASTRGRKS